MNVVQLRKHPLPVLQIGNLKSKVSVHCCRHRKYRIGENERVVECAVCDAQLDPIWVLARLAGMEWDHIFSHAAIRKAHEEIEALKTEVKNLKAQRRRLTK